MKACLYVRCSTDVTKQDMNNQLEPKREDAKVMVYEVVKEHVEYASGANSKKPEFKPMMKELISIIGKIYSNAEINTLRSLRNSRSPIRLLLGESRKDFP